jgi:ketol-acid reductoisomerase
VEHAKEILKDETVAALGYCIQGRAQSLNMRDNKIDVIVGQRKNSRSYELALKEGGVLGKTLFSLGEAAEIGTIKQYLLTDAGQNRIMANDKRYFTRR